MTVRASKLKTVVERAPEEGDYTLLCCAPKILQCFNNANGFLVMYCVFSIVAGSMIGGITNTNIAALERRFGLDSSESAFIVVSYDIAFCVITVFVAYFGAKSNIPRLVAVGAALFGLGAFTYALPHFTSPLYNFGELDLLDELCKLNSTRCSNLVREDVRYNKYILLLGQVLMGFGATPLFTLGIAYIEDSVAKNKAPIYLGIANACSLLGPVLGFTCGGSFLTSFYVDFDGVNVEKLGFEPSDPRWVGAWWIGPLLMSALCFGIVIPFWGFPKQLPGTAKHRAERKSEEHQSGIRPESVQALAAHTSFENLPKALSVLLKNPVYVLLVIAGCLSGGTVSGATSFLSKFVQNEFHLTAGKAAVVAGAVVVPAAAAGHLFGGFLISKFKWKTSQIIVYTMVCCLVGAGLTPSMLSYCNDIPVAGVTVSYVTGTSLKTSNVSSTCNAQCGCQQEFFVPLCGSDNLTYFSPCHAGCTAETETNTTDIKTFTNCSCIEANLQQFRMNDSSYATSGFCEQSCNRIYIFLPLIFLLGFVVFQSHTSATVIAFRIVPESLRAFGVGLAWLFFRALGTIPGPIMFGRFVDSSCVQWQEQQCTENKGACWIYNNSSLAITFMTLCLVGNALAGIFFGLSWFVYRPPPESAAESSRGAIREAADKMTPYDNPAYSKSET